MTTPNIAHLPSATERGAGARLPQLDGLRALAVMAVLLHHFSTTLQSSGLELGLSGVRLFYVLSGFLITGILLRCRDRIRDGLSTAGHQLRQFYLRRSLRIFPAFYATLLLAAALNMGSTRPTFWWHFFYASNFLMAHRGAWIDIVSHFWSLAVEEQFYLIWPWVVLFAPPRRLPLVIGLAVATGPITRWVVHLLVPDNPVAAIVLTPACFDQLGAGAWLGWLWHTRGAAAAVPGRWRAAGLVLLALDLPAHWLLASGSVWAPVLLPLAQSFAFLALIDGAARGYGGPAGAVLNWGPLRWTGQISYGLYLLHNFSHWWAPRILRQLTHYRMAYLPSETLNLIYLTALSFGAATLSWYLLERPLNRLKSRIAYAA